MPDREKVLNGLECCKRESKYIDDNPCDDCPYYDDRCYHDEMMRDAIALLKEQREQIDKLLEENASNAEMAEGLQERLKEQERIIKQYQKADGFLFAHGWKWEGR